MMFGIRMRAKMREGQATGRCSSYAHSLESVPIPILVGCEPEAVCIWAVRGGVFARRIHARCSCGLRQRSVCTYTTSLVPTGNTKEIGDVLEVSGVGVVNASPNVGIAVAVDTGNGLRSGALSRVARLRGGAIGRAVGLLLGLRALLGWTCHCVL